MQIMHCTSLVGHLSRYHTSPEVRLKWSIASYLRSVEITQKELRVRAKAPATIPGWPPSPLDPGRCDTDGVRCCRTSREALAVKRVASPAVSALSQSGPATA